MIEVSKLGEPLTLQQFAEIVTFIQDDFKTYWPHNRKWIKYIYPAIDMRDNKVFNIKFRAGKTYRFDFRDSPEPMYDRIMKWLKEEEK
jgi:chromosome condensin MukBEF complex kleisin-like MukF subunit